MPTLERGAQRHHQCLGCHCHCHCPTGLAESLGWCSPALGLAGTETGAFLGVHPSWCPHCRAGALRGLQESGCHSGCAALGRRLPLLSPGERISSKPCSVLREPCRFHFVGVKHEDVSLHRVISRGLAWLMICPLIFHGVCVCFLSLTFSESLSCFD